MNIVMFLTGYRTYFWGVGCGNSFAAQLTNIPDLLETVDFKDMFLDSVHLKQSFPDYQVCFTNSDGAENWDPRSPFRIRLPKMLENNTNSTPGKMKSTDSVNDAAMSDADDEKEKLIVEPYMPPDPGPYPQDQARQNSVRFTPKQIEVITSGTARTYNGCGSTCYGKDIQLCRS